MELKQAIFERRSVRRFSERPVEKEKLTELLDAGIWSPTGGNAQPWYFVAVTEPRILKLIKTVSPGLLGNPSALIVVFSDIQANIKKMGPVGETLAVMDCSMASQNIMLRAHDLELGSCVIRSFNRDAVREILKAPESILPELIITLGYPEGSGKAPLRKKDILYWNAFGEGHE